LTLVILKGTVMYTVSK